MQHGLPFKVCKADKKVHLSFHRNQVVPKKCMHFLSVIIAGEKKAFTYLIKTAASKSKQQLVS